MATRLRDRMIAEMEVRGLKEGTKSQYLDSMEKFAEFHNRPPVKLGVEDIKKYQLSLLKEKELAANSINKELSGIRFFYRYVLGRHWYTDALPRVKTSRKMPAVLRSLEGGEGGTFSSENALPSKAMFNTTKTENMIDDALSFFPMPSL